MSKEYAIQVFTSIEREKLEESLKKAYEDLKQGKISNIHISTTPDYIDKNTLKMIKKYKAKIIELDVQSTNDYILKKIGRKYTFTDIKKASKMIRWNGFKLGHQMMVGLPESTKIDDLNTAKSLIKLKPKMVKIYPVLVVKGTQLEKVYENGEYEPLTVVQAVETCKELVAMFNKKHIEEIEFDGESYHPAFRQLVESGLWYDSIVSEIKKLNVKVKEVQVTVNPIDVDNVIGNKKENAIKLKDLYDVDLIVEQDEEMHQGKSKIEITKTYNDFLEE